jgi:hemoglobin-like flavoprotein
LVQASFARIAPDAARCAALLYGRLFAREPSLRALFTGEMQVQGKRLMVAIDLLVRHCQQPDDIRPLLRRLGRRHVGYGVQPEDYDAMGEALLWALRQTLGDEFTRESEAAWRAFYRLVAAEMRAATKEGGQHIGL